MLFSAVLFSNLLLAPRVLAALFESGSLAPSADVVTNAQAPFYNPTWAGAVLDGSNGMFSYVSGTVTLPVTSSGSDGDSAAIWLGIDGVGCTTLFQTGVILTIKGGQPVYNAWYEMYPAVAQSFNDISVSAGDVVRFTIDTSSATNSGTARVENLSNGQWQVAGLVFPTPLCGQSVEWIVEDYLLNGELASLANFGTVTFTGVFTYGNAGTYDESNASIVDIEQNNQVLTDVSIDGSSITIGYIG